MRDALAAEGNQAGQRVGIDTIAGEPSLVKPDHVEQIASRRVTGHEDFALATTIFCDVLVCPCHGSCGIVEDVVDVGLGQQAVVGSHNHQAAVSQLAVDVFVATLDASAVEPYDNGRVLSVGGVIDIEFAALLCVGISRFRIGDVILLLILRLGGGCE